MTRVTRSLELPAEPPRVWDLVSDPHALPRWWPRTRRVEDVRGSGGATRWTAVLETERGSGLRADYRMTSFEAPRRVAWEQELAGTPFDRILRHARLAVGLAPTATGTLVALTSDETMRGLSRLGAPLMRGAAAQRLDEALAGIRRALLGEGNDEN